MVRNPSNNRSTVRVKVALTWAIFIGSWGALRFADLSPRLQDVFFLVAAIDAISIYFIRCEACHDPLVSLTPREREVLQLMAEGRTNTAIASQLYIGVGAVEKNVTSIFGKLALEDSGEDHRRVLAVLAWLQR